MFYIYFYIKIWLLILVFWEVILSYMFLKENNWFYYVYICICLLFSVYEFEGNIIFCKN